MRKVAWEVEGHIHDFHQRVTDPNPGEHLWSFPKPNHMVSVPKKIKIAFVRQDKILSLVHHLKTLKERLGLLSSNAI